MVQVNGSSTSDTGSSMYFCCRLAVPLATAISMIQSRPLSRDGNAYLKSKRDREKGIQIKNERVRQKQGMGRRKENLIRSCSIHNKSI